MGETQSRQDFDTQQQCARAEKYRSKKARKTRGKRSGKRRHRRKSSSSASETSSSSDVYETRHKRSDSGSSLFSETSSVYSTSSSSSAESDYQQELLAKRQQACLQQCSSEQSEKHLTKTSSFSSISSLTSLFSNSSLSSDTSNSSCASDEDKSSSASSESKQDQSIKTSCASDSQGCGQTDSSTCSESVPSRFIPENRQACSPDFITCCKNVATFLSEAASKNSSGESKCDPPNVEYIYCYMRLLFDILQLPAECCVIADIYFRRLIANTKGTLKIHSGNWQRILVGSCLLASKYLDDESVENADFSFILTGCSLEFMNKLECKFLQLLNWRLYVPLEEYTERCSQLGAKADCNVDWNVDFIKVKPHFTVRSRNIEIN